MARRIRCRRHRLWPIFATFVALTAVAIEAQAPRRYQLTDLGTLGGGSSEAAGINNLGDVVGSSTTAEGAVHAFLYRAGRMVDLGTLPGGTFSYATALADNGMVVGYGGINAYGPQFREVTQGFVWQDGIVRPLGALYCPCTFNVRYGTSRAFAVTNAGHIVGDSRTNRAASTHAFLWQANAMRDLVAEEHGAASSAAYAINDLEEIVGEVTGRAFLVSRAASVDLGVLPGHVRSSARAVNNRGQVAGLSVAAGGTAHAVLWDSGTPRGLGELFGDAASEARAINFAGQVVGRSGSTDFSSSRAVLWQAGAALDLNSLTNAAGWVLTIATGVNNAGQIAGVGLRGGQRRAFRLDPM